MGEGRRGLKERGEVTESPFKGSGKTSHVSSTTSTTLGRIRGFTLVLIYVLGKGRFRVKDLAEITGKPSNYLSTYLYRMYRYGLAEKKGSFWNLTPKGLLFYDHLINVDLKKKIKQQKKQQKKQQRKQQLNNIFGRKRIKQTSFTLWLQKSRVDEVEKEIVEVLLDHYNRTGSKFILVRDKYELAERCKVNPSALGEALKNLREDNIIYIYHLRREGVTKIGLKKDFIKLLEMTG